MSGLRTVWKRPVLDTRYVSLRDWRAARSGAVPESFFLRARRERQSILAIESGLWKLPSGAICDFPPVWWIKNTFPVFGRQYSQRISMPVMIIGVIPILRISTD